ncbi:MAG: hypothetical protein H6557_07410 [Lewinellaceae bacterium]|nr:hypothetical protein [Lewinellaceae bacterium]
MSNAAWRKKDKPEWTVYSFVVPKLLKTAAKTAARDIKRLRTQINLSIQMTPLIGHR